MLAGVLAVGCGVGWAQPVKAAPTVVVNAPAMMDKDPAQVQEQLIKLLRLTPTLADVVARDPSLLADQEYVNRTNPELAQFLTTYPEVARNPDFYLFSGLNGRPGRQALERRMWQGNWHAPDDTPGIVFVRGVIPFLVFSTILTAMLWLIHVLLENRRWTRAFKLQADAHAKLIDRFANNQELLAYMGTEAGQRFLEAAPIAVDFERDQHVPSLVAKVLAPLQIGIVLALLGAGLLGLRHSLMEVRGPLTVMGVVFLMPGLGFILSACLTWMLAGRLGLVPNREDAETGTKGRL